jgi:hypothetical protein
MDDLTITLKFRNCVSETEDGVTKITGTLLNLEDLVKAIIPVLLADEDFIEQMRVSMGFDLTVAYMENMTPEELTAIWERFNPLDE